MDSKVMKEYIKKVTISVLVIIMFSATAAAVVFSAFKALGLYPNVSMVSLAIFVSFVVVEDVLGGVLIKKSIDQVELSDTYERSVKLYFLIIL